MPRISTHGNLPRFHCTALGCLSAIWSWGSRLHSLDLLFIEVFPWPNTRHSQRHAGKFRLIVLSAYINLHSLDSSLRSIFSVHVYISLRAKPLFFMCSFVYAQGADCDEFWSQSAKRSESPPQFLDQIQSTPEHGTLAKAAEHWFTQDDLILLTSWQGFIYQRLLEIRSNRVTHHMSLHGSVHIGGRIATDSGSLVTSCASHVSLSGGCHGLIGSVDRHFSRHSDFVYSNATRRSSSTGNKTALLMLSFLMSMLWLEPAEQLAASSGLEDQNRHLTWAESIHWPPRPVAELCRAQWVEHKEPMGNRWGAKGPK